VAVREAIVAQHLARDLKMREAQRHLRPGGQPGGRAHFLAHRVGQVARARLEGRDQAVQQVEAFGDAGPRIAVEGFFRRGDRAIDIRRAAHRDPAHRPLGRGIDDIELRVGRRVGPAAVDIELQRFTHDRNLLSHHAPENQLGRTSIFTCSPPAVSAEKAASTSPSPT